MRPPTPPPAAPAAAEGTRTDDKPSSQQRDAQARAPPGRLLSAQDALLLVRVAALALAPWACPREARGGAPGVAGGGCTV